MAARYAPRPGARALPSPAAALDAARGDRARGRSRWLWRRDYDDRGHVALSLRAADFLREPGDDPQARAGQPGSGGQRHWRGPAIRPWREVTGHGITGHGITGHRITGNPPAAAHAGTGAARPHR